MKSRIYADTSVIGGCLDDEFKDGSLALFETFKSGTAIIVVSDVTKEELKRAPEPVRNILLSVPTEHTELVELTDETRDLANTYLATEVVSQGNLIDAQHIAIATVNRVDVLVSWNFKHMVNLERIHGYNSVNLRLGYPMLEIRTPIEVQGHEN